MSPVQDDGVYGAFFPAWIYPYFVGGVAAATVLVLLSRRFFRSPTHQNGVLLPPGPPARWPWQNPFPKRDIMRGLAALVEQYGPVISLRSGHHVMVVIGRMDAAAEIMEKEGSALVDRPRMVAAAELLSDGNHILFQSAGDKFRRLRRAVHAHLQAKVVATYEEIQVDAAKEAILDILHDPKQYVQHVERYAAVVILRVTYGKTSPTSNDDPEVVRIHQVLKNFRAVLRPGAYLVDFIPWLKYLPGYDRQLKEFHRYELSLFRDQLNRVRADMATKCAGPSFGRTLLEYAGDHQLSEDEMAYLAGTLFSAGFDTTASGVNMLIMVAACHPDVQARVQEELDEVVGRDRVPTFGDWNMLPQLQAFILEALRWRPVAPLGVAHRATRDIVWRGMCIPAGATVLGCHWAISRDPVVFPDPEVFDPQRWLTEDGRIRTDMYFYTYGFGRRVCPGQHIANRSLYINLALLLWSFRILERPNAPIDLTSGFEDPVVFNPDPFPLLDFVPRVEERRLRMLMA